MAGGVWRAGIPVADQSHLITPADYYGETHGKPP